MNLKGSTFSRSFLEADIIRPRRRRVTRVAERGAGRVLLTGTTRTAGTPPPPHTERRGRRSPEHRAPSVTSVRGTTCPSKSSRLRRQPCGLGGSFMFLLRRPQEALCGGAGEEAAGDDEPGQAEGGGPGEQREALQEAGRAGEAARTKRQTGATRRLHPVSSDFQHVLFH